MCQQKENNIEIETVIKVTNENGKEQNTQLQNIIVNTPNYDIYWDRNGKEILKVPNKEIENRTFIVKTDKDQRRVYAEDINFSHMWANVNNISKDNAELAEAEIAKGKHINHSSNIVQIQNINILQNMLKIAKNDPGTGGLDPSCNREYGGIVDLVGKITPVQGGIGNPEHNQFVSINFSYSAGQIKCTFHTHPSGRIERYYINGTEYSKTEYEEKKKTLFNGSTSTEKKYWMQAPSNVDTQNINTINYVFAMYDKLIYVYSNLGVLACFSQKKISDYISNIQKTEMKNLETRQKQEKNNIKNKSKVEKEKLKQKHKLEKEELDRKHKNENAPLQIP